MASSSFSFTCPKTTKPISNLPTKICCRNSLTSRPSSSSSSSLVAGSSLNASAPAFSFQSTFWKQTGSWRLNVQLNDVASDRSLNSAPILEPKSESTIPEKKEESLEVSDENKTPDESTILTFMNEISDLIKMVDASSIVELELKQLGCEVTIRKKEAVEKPQSAAPPVYAMPPQFYPSAPPPQAAAPVPAAAAAPPSGQLALPAPAAKPTSSHPPLKCPMAGTFYRCPAPGEPPFVKVGDVVKKGQVVCIIEAMKLMNEIEADSSGTITDILVDDGKPVSVDTPLFVIAP